MTASLRALCCALVCLLACGEGGTTGGRPVALQTELRVSPEVMGPFTSETGWTVELTQAAVSIGALYYFDGPPAYVRAPSRSRAIAHWLGLSTAHAHPGHYLAGMALGQMTTAAHADLLAGTTPLPTGEGITGDYRSARFTFAAPGADDALLRGHVAVARGVARKGAQTVHFSLHASFADVTKNVTDGAVEGCVFEAVEVTDDGRVTVTISPEVWFNLVDFAELTPGTAQAPAEAADGSTAQIAFSLGVVQLGAYRFSFTPATE